MYQYQEILYYDGDDGDNCKITFEVFGLFLVGWCLLSFSSRIVNTSKLQLQTDEFKSAGPVGVSSEQGSRGVSITLLCSW